MSTAQDERNMSLLCLHDADPYGYNIVRTLREATVSCSNHKIDVIDLGLKLEEGLALGLEPEFFIRKKAFPKALELTEVELAYFTGEEKHKDGKRIWKARRIELNDLSKDPDRFLAWIEEKLRQHGLAKKFVPPRKAITEEAKQLRAATLSDRVHQHLQEILKMPALVDAVSSQLMKRISLSDIPDCIKKWALELEPVEWRTYVEKIVRERIENIDDQIRSAAASVVGKGKNNLVGTEVQP